MSPRLSFSKATDCFRSHGSGKLTKRKATKSVAFPFGAIRLRLVYRSAFALKLTWPSSTVTENITFSHPDCSFSPSAFWATSR